MPTSSPGATAPASSAASPVASAVSPRFLYLHGFGSGPRSLKGLAVEAHLAARGIAVDRLDLRVPTLERLSLSRMIETTVRALGGERDRALIMGSSLGGLCAAKVAAEDARVCALLLLAPAFRLTERWRERLGAAELERWAREGWLEIDDYQEQRRARVHYAFFQELEALDAADPYADVRVPTLVIHGRQDDVVDIETSRAWARSRRNVRLVERDDGHELVASLPAILAELDRFAAPLFGDAR